MNQPIPDWAHFVREGLGRILLSIAREGSLPLLYSDGINNQ
jgi:hypothetical protein